MSFTEPTALLGFGFLSAPIAIWLKWGRMIEIDAGKEGRYLPGIPGSWIFFNPLEYSSYAPFFFPLNLTYISTNFKFFNGVISIQKFIFVSSVLEYVFT